jgi:hypothetical protein
MSEEQFALAFLVSFFVPLLASIPFWSRLLERHEFDGILSASMLFGVGLASVVAILGGLTSNSKSTPFEGYYVAMSALGILAVMGGLFSLKTGKRHYSEPRYSVIDLALQGRWDLLERAGVPKNEIEQLKRLTPQQRALILAPLKRRAEKAVEQSFTSVKKNNGPIEEDISIFPGSLCGDLECRIRPLGELPHERFGERHW